MDVTLTCASLMAEYREECEQVSANARHLAAALLGQCANSREVTVLLEESVASNKYFRQTRYLRYPRLKLAMEHNHKEFAAHIFCQQFMRKEWVGWSGWCERTGLFKLIYSLLQVQKQKKEHAYFICSVDVLKEMFQCLLAPFYSISVVFVATGRDMVFMRGGEVPEVKPDTGRFKSIFYR